MSQPSPKPKPTDRGEEFVQLLLQHEPVLRFNRARIEDRLASAAAYLGIAGGFDGFYEYVGSLNASLNIPENLSDLGVTDPDIDALVTSALADPSTGGNPVEMTAENTRALLLECL